MKVVIKLLIVALIANATWRVGTAYVNYYKFKDAVREMTQYRGGLTDAQIHDKIFEFANEYSVPVTEDTLAISHDNSGTHTIVEGSYTQPIDLLPGVTYPWPFTVHVDTFVVEPPRLGR